ncbi:YceD family protein [Brevifollis gellanilyticus]|uniref:DUF177 domain-containing protein n=1 Tax=Brevifollis gellanilyticus TaxID=748831 RepID=A0A512MGB7_9BACT|nr:DUF177 domain-containing protein [Brevifollis gellanilyticus]GEP45775.1 hypothetical protein BGE01nite_50660 [Brevifollis gellanilyticus]
MNPFHIDLRHLPGDGKQLQGTELASFFALPETDTARAESPLTYDLQVIRDDENLVITGSVEAEFSLECGRCLERYRQRVDIPDYVTEVPIEKEGIIDLTDAIREDILLTLPNFPRCEDGNVDPRDCPAEGRFDATESPLAPETPGTGKGVWSALDNLKN